MQHDYKTPGEHRWSDMTSVHAMVDSPHNSWVQLITMAIVTFEEANKLQWL